SIKQAAEGGTVSAEYQEHFGEHAYDDEGNFIGGESSEAQEAWAEYYAEHPEALAGTPVEGAVADVAEATDEAPAADEAPAEG
ncbi:MAG: 30S ribosomal protein S1, partial [Acidimicrobiales bacterium]|nr:30S ribosomal protein S1 [Acidimicrobiales bacterium]